MRANDEDKKSPENDLKSKIDHDLTHCPLSLSIMRHPVLLSDGKHYELEALNNYLTSNPQAKAPGNNLKITSVIYDFSLKQTLDNLCQNNTDYQKDRYKDYNNHKDLLNSLEQKITPSFNIYSALSYVLNFNICDVLFVLSLMTSIFLMGRYVGRYGIRNEHDEASNAFLFKNRIYSDHSEVSLDYDPNHSANNLIQQLRLVIKNAIETHLTFEGAQALARQLSLLVIRDADYKSANEVLVVQQY